MGKVVVFGTFDGLHPGHINFFEQAKKLGDYLVVVVGRDVTVNEVKGRFPKRSELLRLKAVQQCQVVNEAMLGNIGNPYEIIKKIKPDIIALGYDQNSFTKNLPDYTKKDNLKIEIVRLKAHNPETYKSRIINFVKMEERKIIINQLSINCKFFGGNDKPAVLVLHGWGVGSDAWVEAAVLLAQENCRVIVPDMPGFGKSETPVRAWSVDDYVKWAGDFTAAIGLENFILMGHSFGGQIASKFCATNPEKVDKLILCAAAVIRKPRLGSRQLVAKYLAKTKIIFQNIPFGIYPVLRKIVYRIAGTRDYAQLQGVMAQTFLNVVGESVLDSAAQIKIPTLIVWGNKDKETPIEDAYQINKAIAGSKLEIIKNAGHKLHRTHTAELAEIISQFLK